MSGRIVLDTHALIWALASPRRLPAAVVRLVRDPATDVYVSAVSTWEVAIKAALGKIDVDLTALVQASRDADFEELPITVAHTARLLALPGHHRDPFDRLLVAQALEERLAIVTHDRGIRAYAVPVVWDG